MLRKIAFSAALLVLMLSTCPVAQAQDSAAAATQAMAAASAASGAASAAQQSAGAAAKAAQAAASSALASGSSTWIAPASFVVYSIPFIVLFGSLIAILVIRSSLPDSWSLADALSEEVPLPIVKKTVAKDSAGKDITTEELVYDKDGKPALAPVMKASSSRVIALMGMLAILFMFIGFGTFALYGFGKTGKMPESVDDLVKFLAAGMTLFAPYVVNKFASLFQGLTGSK